jgi:hypothetical protein
VPANPDVEAWFRTLDHPLKDAMQIVRSIVLRVDDRIEEAIKWKSPTFMFEGNIASIDPRTKKQVNLMFHQGAKLVGKHPLLEGGAGTVRYMRFDSAADVTKKRKGLEAAIRAWIDLKSRPPDSRRDQGHG